MPPRPRTLRPALRRERLNKWAGGMDTYQELYRVAREVPADMKPENVEPRRWWRAESA